MGNSTATIGPNGYNMGQGGYSGYARIQLPGMGKAPSPFSMVESPAIKFRKDILYYFSNMKIDGYFLGIKAITTGGRKIKSVKDTIDEAKKQNWGKNAEQMIQYQTIILKRGLPLSLT